VLFDFSTREQFEERASAAILRFADRLEGRLFHVRMKRRGHKGEISSHLEENFLQAVVLEELERRGKPHASYSEVVPAAERMSREDLIKTANMYFSGMEKNDGKGNYPFTDDCNRIENGSQTTNAPLREGQTRPDPKTATSYSSAWGCKEQFDSGLLHFVWRIRDRRLDRVRYLASLGRTIARGRLDLVAAGVDGRRAAGRYVSFAGDAPGQRPPTWLRTCTHRGDRGAGDHHIRCGDHPGLLVPIVSLLDIPGVAARVAPDPSVASPPALGRTGDDHLPRLAPRCRPDGVPTSRRGRRP